MNRAGEFLRAALGIVPLLVAGLALDVRAQDPQASRRATLSLQIEDDPRPQSGTEVLMIAPRIAPQDRPLPINLPTALRLAQVAPLDIAIASQRLEIAAAELQRSDWLWLPSLYLGGDYYRHDGQLQDVAGVVFGTSKSSVMVGVGPSMVFAFSDALFAPLAARQVVESRQRSVQAAQNDSLLAVAEAYFSVQQARGDLAAANETARQGEELLRKTEKLAQAIVPPLEIARVRTELARRRQAVHVAQERWRIASAELARVLRLDMGALVQPIEPPQLQVPIIDPRYGVDELIPIALTYRPELAAQQALVQATLERLRQERLRPLIPSLLIRGTATNPASPLAAGYSGGGRNDRIGNFSWRNDIDIQVLWELQNLGMGNVAKVNERRAENQIALLELFRFEDAIAAEVARAHAQVESAAARIGEAKIGLDEARRSVEKNFEAMTQTRRIGDNVLIPIVRPQEAVAALQALAQAATDYFAAVADFNRAQFRLYRALGNPQWLMDAAAPPELHSAHACP